MRKLVASATLLIVGLLLLTAVVQADVPADYDANGNGVIEKDEAYQAVYDFLANKLSLEGALSVVAQYRADQERTAPTPTPSPSPVPTPTTAWWLRWSTPTPTPTAVPLQSPTITYTRINQISIQISWEGPSQEITGYEVRYQKQGGEWNTYSRPRNAVESVSVVALR